MVALKPPRAPRPSCDRYGHPVCSGPETSRCELLRSYLVSHETEVAGRWTTLYRQIYREGQIQVSEEQLVEAIQAALHELEDVDETKSSPLGFADEESRRLLKQVCLTGFECHGCLVPRSDWEDERSLQEAREQLRRRLFCMVHRLLG